MFLECLEDSSVHYSMTVTGWFHILLSLAKVVPEDETDNDTCYVREEEKPSRSSVGLKHNLDNS